MHINAISVIASDELQDLTEAYRVCPDFAELYATLQDSSVLPGKHIQTKLSHFMIQDNILYYDQTCICIPREKKLRGKWLEEHHDVLYAGHFGADKTYLSIQRHAYWPKMYREVHKYVESCDLCQ